MNLGPKKDGSPNIDFFQSPETLQGFEVVRSWLQKHHKKVCQKVFLKKWLFLCQVKICDIYVISSLSVCTNRSTDKGESVSTGYSADTVPRD